MLHVERISKKRVFLILLMVFPKWRDRVLEFSLLFAFYAYGGIEMMGVMAIHLRNKEDTPKSGKVMLGLRRAYSFRCYLFIIA